MLGLGKQEDYFKSNERMDWPRTIFATKILTDSVNTPNGQEGRLAMFVNMFSQVRNYR